MGSCCVVNYMEAESRWAFPSITKHLNYKMSKPFKSTQSVSSHAKTQTKQTNKQHIPSRGLSVGRVHAWTGEEDRSVSGGRGVLLHQCPLWIPKWTIYHDVCWEQEEGYQSHHNLSLPPPKSWDSNCLKGKTAQLKNSYAAGVFVKNVQSCTGYIKQTRK